MAVDFLKKVLKLDEGYVQSQPNFGGSRPFSVVLWPGGAPGLDGVRETLKLLVHTRETPA